jgi:hypothetical protein
MDENTKDIAISAIGVGGTVAGTIVGAALTAWLQQRRRHDEQKREAYAKFLALVADAEASAVTLADTDARNDPISRDWGSEVVSAFGLIEVVGSDEAIKRGRLLAGALAGFSKAYLSDLSDGVRVQREQAEERLRAARQEFMSAVRKDLGIG